MAPIAQVSPPASQHTQIQADAGTDIANWADSPEKTAFVWIGGIVVLVAIFALCVKMKRDADG